MTIWENREVIGTVSRGLLDNLGELTHMLWLNFILGFNFISFGFGYANV